MYFAFAKAESQTIVSKLGTDALSTDDKQFIVE